jgi:DNA adenine methylase
MERELFYELLDMNTSTMGDFERAVRFFVLNRITFSGVVEAGVILKGLSMEDLQNLP